MKRLGLGEHGDVIYARAYGSHVAMVYVRDYSGRKRRVKRAGPTKAAARREVLKAVAEALNVDRCAEVGPSSRFMVGVDAWLSSVAVKVREGKRAHNTLRLYQGTVDRCMREPLGELRVGEVTTPRVDRFLEAVRADKGYATAKACRTVLSGACGWLVRQGAMASNPVREATALEAPHKAARALNVEQVTEWLALVDADADAVRRELPELCRFMLATGVRVGEALGVAWPDVDLDTGWVAIEHTVIRIKGRGLVLSRLKSQSSYRTLVLAPWAVEMLRERRRRRAAIGGPIFPSTRGTLRDPSNTLRDLREVRRQDESLAWVTSHTFRKTLATLLDGAGESARVVADQLGHSRISMTQDHYMGRRAVAPAAADVMQQFAPFTRDAGSDR